MQPTLLMQIAGFLRLIAEGHRAPDGEAHALLNKIGEYMQPSPNVKADAKFYGEIYKAKDDSRVPDDEYIVFLVKDNAFAAVLPLYLHECIQQGADGVQVRSVQRMIKRVESWRAQHPHRLKVPDAQGEKLLVEG